MIIPWAITLWVAGQIPLATELELPTGEKVFLEADLVTIEPANETLIARGRATLRTERMAVRADEVVYDQANERAVAKGNVMLVSGLLAAVADEIRFDMRSLEAQVEGGLLLRKKNVTPEQLLQAKTPHELKKTGETVFTLTGSRIKRIGPNEFLVDDLAFTPCDCDPTEPSWRLEARSAQVELGERALLTFPAVYVYQVPIFWLPWLYLPLADRRTGLLVPRPNFSALNGFSLEQPVFVTFGPSYDATFTPGYYLGGAETPAGPPPFGIRGGRIHAEFRYAPSERTSGRASLGLVYDLWGLRDALNPGLRVGSRRGLRGDASWHHVQDLGNGWRNRVDAGFVSDGYYHRDVTADVLARQAEYLRSTAVFSRSDERSWFGIDALVRQQIWAETQQLGFGVLGGGRLCAGPSTDPCSAIADIAGPRTFARAPAVTYAVPERPLAGPLWAGIRAEYARLGPFRTSFGDEGVDGVYRSKQVRPADTCAPGAHPATCYEPTQGNGQFEPGEREARHRLDLNPRFSLPFGLGRFARFTPYVGLRETVFFGEKTYSLDHRTYLLTGASASTTLIGDLGGGKGRHSITPHLEVRAVPFRLGGVPGGEGLAYDEVDLAVPSEGLVQGVAELRQEIGLRRGGTYRDLLRLDVGQGFDLAEERVADTYARATFREGPVTLSGIARYDLRTRFVIQVAGQLAVNLGNSLGLSASYDNLLVPELRTFTSAGVGVPFEIGRDPLRPSIDALTGRPLSLELGRDPTHCDDLAAGDTPPAPGQKHPCYSRAEQLVGEIRVGTPFGLGARYNAVVQPAAPVKIPQQLVGVSYGPGCNCWRLEVHAWLRPAPPCAEGAENCIPGLLGTGLQPDFGASLTVHQFGSFGTGG